MYTGKEPYKNVLYCKVLTAKLVINATLFSGISMDFHSKEKAVVTQTRRRRRHKIHDNVMSTVQTSYERGVKKPGLNDQIIEQSCETISGNILVNLSCLLTGYMRLIYFAV